MAKRGVLRLLSLATCLSMVAASSSVAFASPGSYTSTNGTTGTSMSGQTWDGITTSASGKYVTAVQWGGDIYASSNDGASWTNVTTATALHGKNWDYISSSASGQYLAATADNEDIYTSHDYGHTWTAVTTSTSLHGLDLASVDMSWTGQYILAAANGVGGGIYTSSNYGASWTLRSSAGTGNFYEVAVSATGQYMDIASSTGDIHVSSNYGVTWTDITAGSSNWGSIATSASGQFVVAGTLGGNVYTSSNYGHTWKIASSAGSHTWQNVQTSYTGQHMVAVGDGGVFVSADYGDTWTNITTGGGFSGLNWYNAAMSASGQYIHASIYGGAGDIYTFANGSLTPAAPGITTKNVSLVTGHSITVDVLSGVSGFPDTSTLAITAQPRHGTVVDPPSTITYTPASGYTGSDTLRYRVCTLFDPAVCSQATLQFSVVATAPNTGFGSPDKGHSTLAMLSGLLSLGAVAGGSTLLLRATKRTKPTN